MRLLGLTLLTSLASPILAGDEESPIDLGPESLEELRNPATSSDEFDILGAGNRFLYDAKTIGFDKEGNRYLFKGNVVLIGGASIITADSISVDQRASKLEAEGHVVLLSGNQVFTGTKISMYWHTGEFTISDSVMVANDAARAKAVVESVLGIRPEESVFQAAKVKHLQDIASKKRRLQEKVLRDSFQQQPIESATIESYSLLLEQEILAKANLNPSLAKKDDKNRRSYLKRRKYWEETRSKGASSTPVSHYIKIAGKRLEKKGENTYVAKEALFTNCRCEDDESPAWGFRADTVRAQEEGYVDLAHPILTIKGIPILYIPYLRIPFKSRRQSGFLMPGFQSGDQKNGFVYTQPVYFDMGEDKDATLTFDVFEKRGTRLGLQARYQMKKYSGFELDLETVRDRSWLEQSYSRSQLIDYHTNINPYCQQTDPVERSSCEVSLGEHLSSPSNTWRGRQKWKGKFFLSPRLSFVSSGSLVSDHRYIEDLYLPEDYVAAFSTKAQANAFSTAKARFNYDHSDVFLGLGSSYGDNVFLESQFKGHQIAGQFKVQSRIFSLIPKFLFNIPIYGSVEADHIDIKEQIGTLTEQDLQLQSLGSGAWQRVKMDLISPVVREGLVRVDYFSDIESRRITHEGLNQASSRIDSYRGGLTINLPIDGLGALPDLFQDDRQTTRYLHHIMNWSVTYSTRPQVIRRGSYGERDLNGAPLVYFASDRDFLSTDGRDVADEDTMIPHRRLTFATSHRFKLFNRGLGVSADNPLPSPSDTANKGVETLHQQAKRELLFYRRVGNHPQQNQQLQDPDKNTVDNYVGGFGFIDTNSSEPVNFSASMTFDFEQERRRQQQIRQNMIIKEQIAAGGAAELADEIIPYNSLPESWSGPQLNLGLNLGGYSLSTLVNYNIYTRASTSTQLSLRLPRFLDSSMSFQYVFEKSPYLVPNTSDLLFKRTKTSTIGISTGLIPKLSTGIYLVQKDIEGETQYGTSLNLSYNDSSGCWGLRFIREKDLNQDEANANYILQLSMIFLGASRSADLSPSLERELPRFTIKN